jgi:hypothetical protein
VNTILRSTIRFRVRRPRTAFLRRCESCKSGTAHGLPQDHDHNATLLAVYFTFSFSRRPGCFLLWLCGDHRKVSLLIITIGRSIFLVMLCLLRASGHRGRGGFGQCRWLATSRSTQVPPSTSNRQTAKILIRREQSDTIRFAIDAIFLVID